MPGFEVRLKGGAVIVDLVENDPVGVVIRDQHVKTPASWFRTAGVLGIAVYERAKHLHLPRLELEIHCYHIARQDACPWTFQ